MIGRWVHVCRLLRLSSYTIDGGSADAGVTVNDTEIEFIQTQ